MNCCGNDCNVPLNIPGTMISYEDGQYLLRLLQYQNNITFEIVDVVSPGFFFEIDDLSTIRETGWIKYPSMQFLAWEAKYLNYLSKLRQRIDQTDIIIPVFDKVPVGNFSKQCTVKWSFLIWRDINYKLTSLWDVWED